MGWHPLRRRHTHQRRQLTANSGTQFDPMVVEALIKVIEPATASVPIRFDDSRPALPGAGIVIPSQAA